MAEALVIIPDSEIEKLKLVQEILKEIGPQAEKLAGELTEITSCMDRMVVVMDKIKD